MRPSNAESSRASYWQGDIYDLTASAPDCLTLSQYRDLRQHRELPPEGELVSAVLQQAIDDWTRAFVTMKPGRYLPTNEEHWRRRREEVRGWFTSDSDAPFTFHWVCGVLGIEPSAVRRILPDYPQI